MHDGTKLVKRERESKRVTRERGSGRERGQGETEGMRGTRRVDEERRQFFPSVRFRHHNEERSTLSRPPKEGLNDEGGVGGGDPIKCPPSKEKTGVGVERGSEFV